MCCLLLSCPLRRLSALPLPLLLKPVSVDSKIQDTKAQDDKTKDDAKTEENKPPDTDDSVDRLGPIETLGYIAFCGLTQWANFWASLKEDLASVWMGEEDL